MKIIHFADLHLGVENYGKIDPETGLSTRLGDFLAALDQLIDYALENKADLVLFCGDAYKTREPSQTQQREFARRINRLASSNIPVFLLAGNHDMPNATWRATTTEIFNTLAVKNIYVSSNKPATYIIPTASGDVQVVAVPWLRRSTLLNREDYKNLTLEQVNERIQEALTRVISEKAAALDPSVPAVLAAHLWVTGAKVGSESMMTIGQEPAVLLSNIALPAFDYVALGHIHKRQVLRESPPVVYSGSLERVDFGEENDEKGFYVVDIMPDGATGKRRVTYDFHPVNARRFLTIDVAPEADDLDPTATVVKAINQQTTGVRDAVVRLKINLPSPLEGQLRNNEINDALKEAHYATVAREVQRETRLRLGDTAGEEIKPIAALKAWLDTQQMTPERRAVLLEYGEKLIQGDGD